MKHPHKKFSAGFTLIEIMLVIVIVVSLMAVLLPNLRSVFGESNAGKAEMYIRGQLEAKLGLYEFNNGFPPTTQQGLAALLEKPTSAPIPRKWTQALDKIQLDPWGMPYQYEYPGKHNPKGFDVYSCGPDRLAGTADDIGNWDSEGTK